MDREQSQRVKNKGSKLIALVWKLPQPLFQVLVDPDMILWEPFIDKEMPYLFATCKGPCMVGMAPPRFNQLHDLTQISGSHAGDVSGGYREF